MNSASALSQLQQRRELLGQTVAVIGGSAEIGLEVARLARAEGAQLIITGRNPETLRRAAIEINAQNTAAFDATDPDLLERFFHKVPSTIDHVMVTAGRPYYVRLLGPDFAEARRVLNEHLILFLDVARNAAKKIRPGGTLFSWAGRVVVAPVLALEPPPPSLLRSQHSRPTWLLNSRPLGKPDRCRICRYIAICISVGRRTGQSQQHASREASDSASC